MISEQSIIERSRASNDAEARQRRIAKLLAQALSMVPAEHRERAEAYLALDAEEGPDLLYRIRWLAHRNHGEPARGHG